MLTVLDCEQGSPEWFAARAGIPTASEFSTVMAKGKDGGASVTRAKYLRQLAGEVLTGEPAPEGYSNGHMERGKEQEDEARKVFSLLTDHEPIRVGFLRNGNKGASPDSLIGAKSGLEIKCAIPAVQIERLQRGTLPSEHVAQVQGSMWVAERDTWHFMSYCPKLPPLLIEVRRDEAYIAKLAEAVDRFNDELAATVDAIRTYSDLRGQLTAAAA